MVYHVYSSSVILYFIVQFSVVLSQLITSSFLFSCSANHVTATTQLGPLNVLPISFVLTVCQSFVAFNHHSARLTSLWGNSA